MKRLAALCAAAALSAVTATARAQSAPPPRRLFGAGSTLGLGIESNTANRAFGSVVGPAVELRFPITPRVELALWAPVFNLVWINLQRDRSFLWLDAFATIYPLQDAGGFFIAPGLGMVWGSVDGASGTGLQVPFRIGYEGASAGRSFGVSIAARPWFDVVFPSLNVDVGARYGALLELTLIGYATRPRYTAPATSVEDARSGSGNRKTVEFKSNHCRAPVNLRSPSR